MKTLAILSDIHANLPALTAVLDDIGARKGIAGIYHLGDLVGYAPWPNEVVSLLRQHDIAGIAGNYDSTVATRHTHCGCRYEDPRQEELGHQSFTWTLAHTTEETRAYLDSLPFRLDLRPWGGHVSGPKAILVHGNPVLNTVYWTEDRPNSFCRQMAEKAGALEGDLMIFGHTHKPWQNKIDGIRFANAGSVGRPKDGDWRACYALLHFGNSESIRDSGSTHGEEVPGIEHVRVEYDLARVQAGIRDSDLPNEFAEILETGGSLKT